MWHRKRATSTVAAPFIVAPSGEFDGVDGNWSTFKIQVGQPSQDFRVFISTAGVVSWLPGTRPSTSNCPFNPNFNYSDPADCEHVRGIDSTLKDATDGWNSRLSNTYKPAGLGNLVLSNDMSMLNYYGSNYSVNITYGSDTFAVPPIGSGNDLSQPSTPFASVPDNIDLFLGSLGLGFGDISLQSNNNASFLSGLANASKIPSKSWGYTAGASYQQDGYTGSLILGGYDQSRFQSTTTTFKMPVSKDESLLKVEVTGIDAIGLGGGADWSPTAKGGSFSAVIDSTLPFIYLPQAILSTFVTQLGLKHDSATDLYTVNSTQAQKNRQSVDTISFTITDPTNQDAHTTITLPYAAFDLNATLPLYPKLTPYVPVRQALSDDTAVLGRAFLQEAYIVADYERNNFTVAQAQFPKSATATVVPIYNTSYSAELASRNSSSGGSGISGGAIAGIVIGVLAAVAILVALVWIFFIRKKRREREYKEAEVGPYTDTDHKEERSGRRNTVDTLGTYDSEQTATMSELAALPAGRPPHSRNLSELSSESEMSRQKRGRTLSPAPIFELEDASDATQWAANERRMQETASHSPNGRLSPVIQEDHATEPAEGLATSPTPESFVEHPGDTSPVPHGGLSPVQHRSPTGGEIISPTSAGATGSPNPIMSPLSATSPDHAAHPPTHNL